MNGYISSPNLPMLGLSQKCTSEAIDPPLPSKKCYQRRIPENLRHCWQFSYELHLKRHRCVSFAYEYSLLTWSLRSLFIQSPQMDASAVNGDYENGSFQNRPNGTESVSRSRRTASKSAASIWAGLKKRQRVRGNSQARKRQAVELAVPHHPDYEVSQEDPISYCRSCHQGIRSSEWVSARSSWHRC